MLNYVNTLRLQGCVIFRKEFTKPCNGECMDVCEEIQEEREKGIGNRNMIYKMFNIMAS